MSDCFNSMLSKYHIKYIAYVTRYIRIRSCGSCVGSLCEVMKDRPTCVDVICEMKRSVTQKISHFSSGLHYPLFIHSISSALGPTRNGGIPHCALPINWARATLCPQSRRKQHRFSKILHTFNHNRYYRY